MFRIVYCVYRAYSKVNINMPKGKKLKVIYKGEDISSQVEDFRVMPNMIVNANPSQRIVPPNPLEVELYLFDGSVIYTNVSQVDITVFV